MLKIDYNPLRKQWNERMENLPDDVREAVQAFCDQWAAFTRKRVREWTIFQNI